MISIQRPITSLANLSDKANVLLGWIPAAGQWVANAIGDSGKNYVFSSESALFNSLLAGLYSSDAMQVPKCGFWASPDYLLGLGSEQIQVLNQVAQGGSDTQQLQQLDSLIAQENLVTTKNWQDVTDFFQAWQIAGETALQQLDLAAVASWQDLATLVATENYPKPVVQGALEFAFGQNLGASATAKLSQFAILLYLPVYQGTQAKRLSTSMQKDFQQCFQLLLGLVLGQLACPQLAPPQTAMSVGPVIQQWGAQQQFIGFTDVPTGLLQSALNLPLTGGQQAAEIPGKFNQFITQTTQGLANCKVGKQLLSQDAKDWIYQIQATGLQASFNLAEDGCLTLNSVKLNS